jgi:hypothetical protein
MGLIDRLASQYIQTKAPNSETKTLLSLYQQPKKEKGDEEPHFQVYVSNYSQQADLLFLPTDKLGYKYALVVVDDHSKKCDATPLKSKTPASVLHGIKTIYKRNILQKPKILEVDSGSEFKGQFAEWCDEQNIKIHTALTARHRQQGLVETKNKYIGEFINKIQAHKELETGRVCKVWVNDLPHIIKLINEHLPTPITTQKNDFPIISKSNKDLLGIGDDVRIKLDYPINTYNGKRLHGDKFRTGDIRWSKKVYKIKETLLKPDAPPLYLIKSDTDRVARTRGQLQFV